jgi:hypothetical protein
VESNWPIVLVEGVLVLGGTLLFGWWQLRSIRRDQEETRRRREAEIAARQPGGDAVQPDTPGETPPR